MYVTCVVILDENLTFFKVKINVCVDLRYNRISAYCVGLLTLYVLRTQGRRRQLKSGTAKLCLRTNFRGVRGACSPELFLAYIVVHAFSRFSESYFYT